MTIIVAGLLTVFFIIMSMVGIDTTISEGLLAITAIIIFWYTTETKKMREEITKQNSLFARPAVVVELKDNKIFLKNDGKGPALNIEISNISVKYKYFEGENSDGISDSTYRIPIVSYLAPTDDREAIFFRDSTVNNLKGTVSEPDEFFKLGKISNFIITYNDFENSNYKTKIELDSGQLKAISFE